MRMKQLCGRLLVAALAGLPLQTWAVGGDGLYFVQNFEDASQYPETKLGQEQTFNVEGQGEWIFYNSFQSTNASYNENGSTMNLRMPKSGSYVVTPLLQQGVSRMTFYIGRASVKAYTSTDGGQTWAEAAIITTGKTCTVTVNSMDVNRIKLANDTSKDADIDNIAVYALQFDQPVRVATGAATDITTSSAVVAATIVENSGETLTEAGFVWSIVNKEPTLSDNVAPAKNVPASDFTVQLTELKQGATVYYRAYVRYANTQTYGEVKSFKVAVEASEQTVAADGTYFVQNFEDPTAFPQESGAQAVEYYVTGQGVWIYNNAYKSTNSNYNVEGSTMNLRLPKNGSYVVTPVLNYGVKSVSYYGPRKGDKLTCYTSKDGGSTWKAVAQTSTGNNNYAIAINDLEVNRIKIANDGKSKPKEWVDIRPILSVDVLDKEAIVKFILPGFEVMQKGEDGANHGFMGNSDKFCFTGDETPKEVQVWPMIACYPYNNDCKFNKTTCYMAYVHAIECYKILKQQVLNAGYTTKKKKR